MPNSPTEKSGKKQVNLNLRLEIWEKFRTVCQNERRNYNAQMEIIIEEWLAEQKKSASEASSRGSGWRLHGKIKS